MNDKKLSRAGALSDLIGSAVRNLKVEERAQPVSGSVIDIDPKKTRMNDLHRRSNWTMSGSAIQEMVEMFRATGQTHPAKGWRLETPDADGVEVVLVYGARRRAAALELGIPLKVELMPAAPSQDSLIALMHSEHRGRRDYLPLEDAREYRAYLDAGAYRTAEQMAEALGQDKGKVSRLLSLLKLPGEVLELYTDPAWLPLQNGAKLASAMTDKPVRARVLEAAAEWKRAGGRGNPTPTLMKALVAKPTTAAVVELKGADGRPIGSVRGGVDTKSPMTILLARNASEGLRRELADVLNRHCKTKL